MRDLLESLDSIAEAPNDVEYDSFADFLKALQTPGKQGKSAREKILDKISPAYMADIEKRKYLDPEAYQAFWDAELNREGYSKEEKAVVRALKQQMDLPFGSKPFDGSYDRETTKLVNITDPKTGEKKTFAVPREPDVPEFAKVGPDGQYDGDDLGNAPSTPVVKSADKLGPDGQYDGDDLGNAPSTPQTQPKDKPRDGGNPGGTTKTASVDPTKKVRPNTPQQDPKISKPARVTYQSLAKASGIEDPDKIRPGQEIKLPNGGVYKVKSGDTLSKIAQDVRLGNIADKPASEPKDTPRDGGNPGGTTIAMPKPTKVAQAPTPVQTGGDQGEFNVAIDTVKKNAGLTDYTKRYNTLPDGSIVKNPEFKPAGMKPSDLNKKPNTGPKYEPLDKDSQTNLQKAQQYSKSVNPNLNVKPVVTPSAASAEKAIGKSGEKAIQAVKKDIDQSYTKKGVDSIYNTIKNLFK